MSKFFNDTLQGLLEAVEIEKGDIPLISKDDMPARTLLVSEKESILIDSVIRIRKELNMSQRELASLTGNKQQAISRLEQKEHSPTLKLFYSIVDALGCELQIVKKV